MALILSRALCGLKLPQMYGHATFCMERVLTPNNNTFLINNSKLLNWSKQISIMACDLYQEPRRIIRWSESDPTNSSTDNIGKNDDNPYHKATIVSVEKISDHSSKDDTYHIVFDHNGQFTNGYLEGQYFGVMPSAKNVSKQGDAKKLRYYFGACSRYGENFNNTTTSLCVRLVPNRTSEFLCKLNPGDEIQVTGPTGHAMLLGDRNPYTTHIFTTFETGIAPFRAHVGRLFNKNNHEQKYYGKVLLFHIVSSNGSILYKEEFEQYQKDYPSNFHYIVIKKNIHHFRTINRVKCLFRDPEIFGDHSRDVFNLLHNKRNAYIYLAGPREMAIPIENTLKNVAKKEGDDWRKTLERLKHNEQWRVQVF
ncbi:hypothetical protein G4B88_004558 [Cannabis sativa]|uniref:ferredoxin--NADP(+) reductase n=1 Tax=Cannabis sativa TaxID=3483 RepID=A0A7J6G4P4_CANSA|nr:hypothetical protein G4B88_004558 [Cannabis sativa]